MNKLLNQLIKQIFYTVILILMTFQRNKYGLIFN